MSAFNPWLGFPARNAVYLDRDFDRQRGNGQAAYGTFQTAYDYAAALAVLLNETVLIYVGEGTAAQLGSLVLTAAWDSRVILVGVSRDVSKVGTITATNGAGAGFAVPLTFGDITVGAITSNGSAGGNNGGAITLIGNGIGSVSVGSITSTGDGDGGAVSLTDVFQSGSINTTGDTKGGNVTFVRSFSTGSLTVNAPAGDAGAVSLDEQSTCGNIITEAAGAVSISVLDVSTIGTVTVGAGAGDMSFTIKNGGKASTVTLGGNDVTAIIENSVIGDFTAGNGNLYFTMFDSKCGSILNPNVSGDTHFKICDSMISASGANNAISVLRDGSVFSGVVMRTVGGNAPVIGSMIGPAGTTQFIDATLIAHGTGVAMEGDTGGQVLCDNLRMSKDSPNVNFTGQYTVNPGYAYPA